MGVGGCYLVVCNGVGFGGYHFDIDVGFLVCWYVCSCIDCLQTLAWLCLICWVWFACLFALLHGWGLVCVLTLGGCLFVLWNVLVVFLLRVLGCFGFGGWLLDIICF